MAETPARRPVGRPRKNPKDVGAVPQIKPQDVSVPKNSGFAFNTAEPGDNSRYLGHVLNVSRLPIIDLNDPDLVRQRCQDYFNMCFEADMKPTVSGLASAFKVSRQTVLNWKTGSFRADSHQAIILEAYGVLESLWEEYMQNGKINPVSGIFLGKNNYGYQDKQEMVLTPNGNNVDAVDIKAIEAKYEELPED